MECERGVRGKWLPRARVHELKTEPERRHQQEEPGREKTSQPALQITAEVLHVYTASSGRRLDRVHSHHIRHVLCRLRLEPCAIMNAMKLTTMNSFDGESRPVR